MDGGHPQGITTTSRVGVISLMHMGGTSQIVGSKKNPMMLQQSIYFFWELRIPDPGSMYILRYKCSLQLSFLNMFFFFFGGVF